MVCFVFSLQFAHSDFQIIFFKGNEHISHFCGTVYLGFVENLDFSFVQ